MYVKLEANTLFKYSQIYTTDLHLSAEATDSDNVVIRKSSS